jgi:hypothetical protein
MTGPRIRELFGGGGGNRTRLQVIKWRHVNLLSLPPGLIASDEIHGVLSAERPDFQVGRFCRIIIGYEETRKILIY